MASYSAQTIEYFENPRNVGELDSADLQVGTGEAGSLAAGSIIRLQIKVNPANEHIEQAFFKAYGCVSTIAVSSWVAQWLEGRSIADATKISSSTIADALGLLPIKLYCAMLAQDAIAAAVADYQQKYSANKSDIS